MPATQGIEPLSERIIAALPGPRAAWVGFLALVPWLLAVLSLALQAAGELPQRDEVARELLVAGAFTYSVLLSLWGGRKLIRGLGALLPTFSRMTPHGSVDPADHFRGIANTATPLVLTAAATLVFAIQGFLEGGWIRAILAGTASLVIGAVSWSFFCVYLGLQLGFDRLGRQPLELDRDTDGRDLGLRPAGRLAFTAFWILIAGLGPIAALSVGDPVGMFVILLTLGSGVAAFFLSLRRLHRQMVATKVHAIRWARSIYRDALEPVRTESSAEIVRREAEVLIAADALERRAERIQEWPFDEATFAQVVSIGSLVTAAIVANLILLLLGM
jgi:hypothetical protein